MGLSNGFIPGAAGGAGGGPPAVHGTTHQPGSTDPLGPMAGQSFYAATAPTSVVDGSVWMPSGVSDPLRGEWLVYHTWRNSGSGRWVGPPRTIVFGADSTDGTYLEIVGSGPSADIAFLCRTDMVITGVSATRSNDGPASKGIDIVVDKNIVSPVYQFTASKGTTFKSTPLDIAVSANSIIGVRSVAAGDPCRISVQVIVAVRSG